MATAIPVQDAPRPITAGSSLLRRLVTLFLVHTVLICGAVFILLPVSGVYYPISVLPHWMQVISWGLPPAYVFEGMRAILAEKTVHWDMLGIAFVLSAVYLVVGFQIFQWFFRLSRRAGSLLGQGE